MKKHVFLLLLSNIVFLGCIAQYRIQTIDESEQRERPSSTLSRNEILLVCLINPKYRVQCSVDRNQWKNQSINYNSAIEITLEDEFAYFFVRVCESQSPEDCLKYRLRPGRRYILRRDPDTGEIVIKTERND